MNNVAIVVGAQQRDSATHTRGSILPQSPLPSFLAWFPVTHSTLTHLHTFLEHLYNNLWITVSQQESSLLKLSILGDQLWTG